MELQLGRLEQVQLRDVWLSESSHFTPWLARPENLSELGRELGIELDHEASEAPVGLFRADLLCREARTGRYVLIENQIEQTDHTHLGQLLTYAAGLSTVTIVWVARTIREEHRAALDWLNEVTSEDIGFFGIEVELWKIGDSPPAPKFSVVSRPNEWTKHLVSERGAANQSDPGYQRYWESFKDYLTKHNSALRPLKAHGQAWLDFSTIGRGIRIEGLVSKRDRFIGIDLVIYDDPDKTRIAVLRERYEQNPDSTLNDLVWDPGTSRKQSKVYSVLYEVDPLLESDWDRQFSWLRERAEAFHRAFALSAASI